MFKKLFKNLTQSASDRYADAAFQFANSIEKDSPQLATTMRQFAKLKQDIDQRIESKDKSMLQIDNLDQLTLSVCDAVQAKIKQLSGLEQQLPEVLTSRDHMRLKTHSSKLQQGHESLLRAYAALHHCATGNTPPDTDSILLEDSPLKSAIDALDVEIRTAARIRNELGR